MFNVGQGGFVEEYGRGAGNIERDFERVQQGDCQIEKICPFVMILDICIYLIITL